MSDQTQATAKTTTFYFVQETKEGSNTVKRIGRFDDYDSCVTTMAKWEPATEGVTRAIVKRTHTTVTTSTTEDEVITL